MTDRPVSNFIKRKLNILPLEKRLMFDASLPAIAGQVLWLDAADATTIIDADGDDAATGTGGANNGFSGTVTTWQDKSTSGFDVSATAGQAPVYTTGALNGNAVLTFDGSNDRLTRATASIPGDDFTTFVVFNRTIAPTREAVLEWGSGGARNALFINEGNNGKMNYYINGGWVHYTSPYVAGTDTLASIVHNTGSISLFRDGTNEVSTAGTVRTGTNNLFIGDDSSGGDNLTGYIAEIIIYDRDLSADERHDVETYLAGKWGLTIANANPTLDTNAGLTLNEATTQVITNTLLSASDTDNTDSSLSYSIVNAANHGILTNTNTAQVLGLGDSFTQGDIDNGFITYTHDGTALTTDSFIFDVSDGYGSVTNRTFSITITPLATLADVQAIASPVLHFDATDIDGDGNTSNQPADGSAVALWDDNVGAANDASASGTTRPLYDDNIFTYNNGGVVFDGVNDALLMAAHNEVNNQNYAEKSFAMTFRTGTDIVSNQLIYEQGGTTNGISFGIWNGDIYAYTYSGGSGGTHYALNLGAAAANTTYQLVAVYDSTTTNTWSASLNNGGFVSMAISGAIPAHSGAPALGNENGATLHAITHASVSGLDFDGAIGEFWSWNHALNAGEINTVQDYLHDKWFDTAHTLTTNIAMTVAQDGFAALATIYLETIDSEAPDSALTYTLTSLPAEGTLYLAGVALNINDTFTQADIGNALITYDHDGTPAPGSDTFGFSVSDGYNTAISGTFTVNIIAAPATTPILVTNSLLSLNEGASAIITGAYLDTNDGNTPDTGLTYTVTGTSANGTLYRNGIALGINNTFTQQDITNNLVTYTHAGAEIFTDNFSFTVSDGTTTLGPVSFNIAINPVNDQAPTNITISNASVNENSANGTVIGSFTSTDADLPGDNFTYSIVADPDNKFQIVGNQLRVNGALDRETQTTHSVTVRTNDGVFTYDKVFTITVNDINESPTIATNTGATLNEGSSIVITTAMLNEGDPDDSGTGVTYTASNYANGHITVNGITQNTFTQADINSGLVVFIHDGSETVTAAFDISLADGGENGATPATGTFNLTINPVNDAPIINGWTLISSEDFEAGATGWVDNTTTNGGAYLTNHLGRFSNDGGVQSNSKTYVLSGTQGYTVIEFDFYRVDSWDTEAFRIFVDDTQIFTQNFTTGAMIIADGSSGVVSWTASELNTISANFAYNSWTDQMFHFTLTIQNSAAGSVKLGFGSTTNQGVTDEAWGIDNVKVYETQPSGTPGPLSVAENTANGQGVGTVNAYDAEGNTITYSITGGTGASAFAINPTTGAITVANTSLLNYEVNPSFTLQITAIDNGTPNLSDVEMITINLIDVPENTTPVVNAAGPFTVAENTANNTVVGTVTATDADGDTLSYSITAGNTDNIFAINSATGAIRISNNAYLNYEHATSYTLTIRATDNGFGNLAGQRNIVINITDVNEAPTFDAIQAILTANPSVQYNAATGNFYQYISTTSTFAIATANANAQTLSGVGGHLVTITSVAENTYVRGLSSVNMWLGATDTAVEGSWTWQGGGAENGVIFWQGNAAGSVQNGLYANWTGGEPNNSGGNEDYGVMYTNGLWNDANGGSYAYVIEWEGADVFAAAPNNGPYAIDENVAGGTSVGFAQAEDVDAGDVLSYSITGGTGSALFQVNSSTGEITVNNGAVLNFESVNSYTLDMRVQDIAGLFDTRTVTINLNDINDIPANFLMSDTTIVENEPVNTLVGTLSAFDEDGDVLTYTLLDDSGGHFKLVGGNQIETDGTIDYEVATAHSITLRVDDGNGGVVDKIFTIDVINLADDAVVPLPDNTGTESHTNNPLPPRLGDYDPRLSFDRLEESTQTDSILQAFLAGEPQQISAFYGTDDFSQILRENTTYEIRELLAHQLDAEDTNTQGPAADQDIVVTDKTEHPSTPQPHFTNLREALLFLSQMDEQEAAEGEQTDNASSGRQDGDGDTGGRTLPHTSLDNQFQDVLTYHQQRQADLRKALMAG
jgi:hypothetical protein